MSPSPGRRCPRSRGSSQPVSRRAVIRLLHSGHLLRHSGWPTAVDSIALPDLSRVPSDELGAAVVDHFLTRWEGEPTDDSLRVLLASAATNAVAAAQMQEIFRAQLAPVVATRLGDRRDARRSGCDADARPGAVSLRPAAIAAGRPRPRRRRALAGPGDPALPDRTFHMRSGRAPRPRFRTPAPRSPAWMCRWPGDDVLIRVKAAQHLADFVVAAGVGPDEWHPMTGLPHLR